MEPLVLDRKALNKLGLHHDALYALEYDIPSLIKYHNPKANQKHIKEGYSEKDAKELAKIRAKLVYLLKYKVRAIRNLDSSWFIDADKLDTATELMNQIKSECQNIGVNMDKKIRIIPILTTEEGFESYEDRKAEFLLQFLGEAMEKVEKGINDEIMSESVLWRCKKAYEIVESTSESLQSHTQYKLIQDTLIMLADFIGKYENIKKDKREAKKRKKK